MLQIQFLKNEPCVSLCTKTYKYGDRNVESRLALLKRDVYKRQGQRHSTRAICKNNPGALVYALQFGHCSQNVAGPITKCAQYKNMTTYMMKNK